MAFFGLFSGQSSPRPSGRPEDMILSIFQKINHGSCSGQFPEPRVFIGDTGDAQGTIQYSWEPDTMKICPDSTDTPLILSIHDKDIGQGVDHLFILVAHEVSHLLNPGKGHGPDFVNSLKARGVTTREVAAVGADVTQEHEIIPGMAMARLRDEWLAETNNGQDFAQGGQRLLAAPLTAIPRVDRTSGQGARPSPGAAPSLSRNAISGPPAHAPQITSANVPRQLKNVHVYVDCSASMYGAGETLLQNAIRALWPIDGARIFTFTSTDQGIHEVSVPSDISSKSQGTEFEGLMLHAERHNPDMVLIFSDGNPSDEDKTWEIWRRTTFPISTHACMPAEHANHYSYSIQLLRDLCRGGGQCTIGSTPEAITTGVTCAMSGGKTNIPAVHRMPDLTAQTKSVARQAAGAAIISGRVIDLGNRISQVEHDVHEAGQRLKILIAGNDVVSGIHEQAGEVFQAQDERDAQDAAARAAASTQLDTGLQRFGENVLGQTQASFAGQIDYDNARAADRGQLVSVTQISGPRMEFGRQPIVNKAGAVLSSQPQSAGLLPPPPGLGRSAPRPAQAVPALMPPSERPIGAAPAMEPRRGRVLAPVKRGS